ncbi:MAG: TonB-dependent receptor, partial [Alphaproteobacteria bacterium]
GVSQANYTAGNYVTTGCVDVGFWPTFATFGQSVNIDEAETRGFEASMNWRFADSLTLTGNYTYTDSEQKSGASIGLPLTNTPEHMLNGALRWDVNEALNVWLRGEYRSERFRGVGAARTALGDFEAYSLFHLGGSYKLSENLTLGATIYNLLDTDFVSLLPYGTPVQYAPEYTNNQEPRRLWLSLNATF